jgi:hypothetical protein
MNPPHNLEHDLVSTDWLVEKVKTSEAYAQNLYAALCNNSFQKIQVWSILTDDEWGCSWRYAGSIIARIRGEGDYLDWYCSGIGGKTKLLFQEENKQDPRVFVSESVITEEIDQDLKTIGWRCLSDDGDVNG